VEVYQADTQDSDLATAQTIATMCGHIHRASQDPVVQQAAKQALSTWGRVRWGTSAPVGVFWWAKHAVKMLPHSKFKALLAAYPEKRQLLVTPEVVLRAPAPAGDCSTFSMLIAAMLEALGVQWELVTVAADPQDPRLYSHVFVRAISADGTRLTLDGSHGKYPGWEVPRAHQFRRQVWDAAGEPIGDQAPAVSQLHEYLATGLGQDDGSDDSGGTYTDASALPGAVTTDYGPSDSQLGISSTDLSSVFANITSSTPTYVNSSTGLTATTVGSNSGYVAPSQSSAQWAAFAAALAKGGMTLAEINAIQPGTVVSANGSILRQATGLPVPVGTGITAALGSSSTMLLLGGVALVVVVMLMSGKSR
jgi:hypothetical protein